MTNICSYKILSKNPKNGTIKVLFYSPFEGLDDVTKNVNIPIAQNEEDFNALLLKRLEEQSSGVYHKFKIEFEKNSNNNFIEQSLLSEVDTEETYENNEDLEE